MRSLDVITEEVMRRTNALATLASCAVLLLPWASQAKGRDAAPWTFAVSGDSRNCGDVVMPAIAAGARAQNAAFYWHLGDLRAIYDFDDDYRQLNPKSNIVDYLARAWPDFIARQVDPFGAMPFFLGIGNHETIAPKTRGDFLVQFADWLDTPELKDQRLRDDSADHALHSWFHWVRDGVDFLYLDNATTDQFEDAQWKWVSKRIDAARTDPAIRAVVVGMHEALPDSISKGHSMSDSDTGIRTGRELYAKLLEVKKTKAVYVLASHSHFYMANIFDTAYWRDNGGVLPGWIVGTAGAIRYPLPDDLQGNTDHRVHTYGYLLATVSPKGVRDADPVSFAFQEIRESDVPAGVTATFSAPFVGTCFTGNAKPGA
jgi:hypothetical protein